MSHTGYDRWMADPDVPLTPEQRAQITTLWMDGRAAWPQLDLPCEVYEQHILRHLPAQGDLSGVHGVDLYLACACARGLPGAAAALHGGVLTQVQGFVARVDSSPAFADEVRQIVAERLLCGPDGSEGRIADYAGTGPLHAWVRVVAVRIALDLRRGPAASSEPLDEQEARILGSEHSPELTYIRRRCQGELLPALREAIAALPHEQRTVLRLQLVGGLSGDRIAKMMAVHRSTVVRWLQAARETLLKQVVQRLKERLGLTPTEIESLIRMARSDLDFSVAGLLMEEPTDR